MSRHPRHILSGLIIGAALLTAGETRVSACSCIGPIVACESAWTADAVFVGKVLHFGSVTETGDQFPRLQRLVRFDVQETFKGVPLGKVEVVTGSGGGDCGYGFIEGRTYIVYAHRNAATGQLGAGICSRTGPIERASEDLAYLRGPFSGPADLGVIRGTVTRHDPALAPDLPPRRAPFGGAEIRLEGYSRAYNTMSADDGSYQFHVPAGEYRLFATVREGVYAWPGTEGRTVWLRDTRGCGIMDIAVRADSRIAGRLVDNAGRPVSFMSVELLPESRLRATAVSATTRTLTDERGRFQFQQLEAGSHAPGLTIRRDTREGLDLAVWINRDGSGLPVLTAVEPEGRVDLGDVRLPSGVSTMTVTGVVVHADGSPVPGATVRFTEPGQNLGMVGAPVTTDEAGRFSLTVIAGRSYRLSAEWFAPTTGQRRYVSARSEPFEAAGEVKPFRLVLGEAR